MADVQRKSETTLRPNPSQKSATAGREEEILEFWQTNNIFKKSLEKKAPKGDFVFYDGPPFATGLPHYGHLLQSAVKDVVPRYKTMQGFHVERQWGWDCHGLPIENIVEKEIGTKSKRNIIAMGVKKFNNLCRERIFTFIHEWERIIPRFGRWADMKNPYRTMDFAYMESEWWVFKKLYDDGLIYEDYRSMHICPRCETTLSQGEVADGYKDVKDISVTMKFKVKNPEKIGLKGDVYLLAWTTTPWTLPGNVALAVNDKVVYARIQKSKIKSQNDNSKFKNDEMYIVAKECIQKIFAGESCEIAQEIMGKTLIGLEYEPLFDYYSKDKSLKNRENGWKVYAADFVSTEEGTGIVHIAPAFGADDWELLKKVNLPFVQHVNMDGTMKQEVKDFAGEDLSPRAKGKEDEVREIDLDIANYLDKNKKLFSPWSKHPHSYPHCWRCDTPLLNYATSSWFVAVTKIKDKLLETAESIEWSPAHIKDGRFGEWLKGARDWSISRQRFWANTIPVWRCEKCKAERVFGSALELEKISGKTVTDLHKDVVDDVTFVCRCGGRMKRVPDVLDTWFDSGSVPFAILHYPFGFPTYSKGSTLDFLKVEPRSKIFPADFIAEAQDQCRAWFYYQHVLMGALFGKEAFRHCIVTGIVLAEDGKKMSKKLNNYPDPMEVIDKYGADALRLYLLSSPVVQAENLCFAEKGVDEVAKKNIGRLNNVLAFYKLYDDNTPRDFKSENILDRWIIARLAALIGETTDGYEKYQLDKAVRPLALFIDDLSVWYLRRSRSRVKEGGADAKAALATLRYVLHTLAGVIAPSMPFLAEHLFQAVKEDGDPESVHLALWPEVPKLDFDAPAILSSMQLTRNFVTMALMQRSEAGIKVRQPLKKLTVSSKQLTGKDKKALFALIRDEVNVKEVVEGAAFALDTNITSELREEGAVRDAIRLVQEARKAAKMRPGEHGKVSIRVPDSDRKSIEKHLDKIQRDTNTEVSLDASR